ncbi:MAG: 3-isopropylmalate dehydratase small subunit [Emcibacter sp.]|nr:3-isopropylmalate dehydratase small subunit [Emcibacter sp.]
MSKSENKLGGSCLKVGDDINSDVIIPGRYLISIDPVELAKHAFEPLGEEFQKKLKTTKVIVAGRNFGCGSAREQAASCLIGGGVQVVVAESFARVFYRNAINTGLTIVESPEAVKAVKDGDELYVDTQAGTLETGGKTYSFPPYPESLQHILRAGGLIPYVAEKIKQEQSK